MAKEKSRKQLERELPEHEKPMKVSDLIRYLNTIPKHWPIKCSFYSSGDVHKVPLTMERLEIKDSRNELYILVEDN